MSKERIENLKSTIKLIKDNVDANTHHFETLALATEIIINHGDWLIEQAERVQELERKLDRVRFVNDIFLEKEKQQNQRYREAIFKALDALPVGFKNEAVRILGEALEGDE